MEKKTVEALKELNVPMGNLGFDYLLTAITVSIADKKIGVARSMTKAGGIYNEIADKHNTTSSRVERAIRHGIERAVLEVDESILKKYFGNTKRKITNGNFIAALSWKIKLDLEEEER